MSYNIDSVDTPVLDAWMYAKDIVKLHKKYRAELPESNFISELLSAATGFASKGGVAPKGNGLPQKRGPVVSWLTGRLAATIGG